MYYIVLFGLTLNYYFEQPLPLREIILIGFVMKRIFIYLLLFTMLALVVLVVPAYWVGYDYKAQLMSQNYSSELSQEIDEFITESKDTKPKRDETLLNNWEGEGRSYLQNNLPSTLYEPRLFLESGNWKMRWVGTGTFAIDTDLKVQLLRLQLKRTNLIQWQLDSICLIDTERHL